MSCKLLAQPKHLCMFFETRIIIIHLCQYVNTLVNIFIKKQSEALDDTAEYLRLDRYLNLCL